MKICWFAFFLTLQPFHADARLNQERVDARSTQLVQNTPSSPRKLTTPLDSFSGQWNLTQALNGTDRVEFNLPPGASITMHLREKNSSLNASSNATDAISAYGLLLLVKHGNLLYSAGDVVSRNNLRQKDAVRVTNNAYFTLGAPTPLPYSTVEEYAEVALKTLSKMTFHRSTGYLTLISPTTMMTFSRIM
eukprot:CAMPEP_0194269144 /NCGR_PEP_ID=MMETSP0169-20130528/3352_1 /TAXON_ID=218684 /ORGANISM="Corethron pennatum, Strain L29A3" /LENGTH=190 /DNA_ID=CAMNT_0039010669 /DNA_START=64 /DNA_END=633 /DNA_ORIENTATION=-